MKGVCMDGDANTYPQDRGYDERRYRKRWRGGHRGGAWGGTYFLAFVGALVYYLQHSTTFWMGVLGILKAIVWPAMLIYKVFEMLKM